MNVTPILQTIRKEIKKLHEAETVISNLNRKGPQSERGARHLSASARKRISQAQKERWAKWQKKNGLRVVGGRKAA